MFGRRFESAHLHYKRSFRRKVSFFVGYVDPVFIASGGYLTIEIPDRVGDDGGGRVTEKGGMEGSKEDCFVE